MPFNVLLLPLLGGYIFLTHWNRTRFETKRYSGERLIFHSASAGVVFLIVSFLVLIPVRLFAPAVHGWWRSLVPFPYAGTSLGAFLIGTVGWLPLNRFVNGREEEQRRTIQEWGDHLEEMLERAIREIKQVSVTMKSGKVYLGFVLSNINPSYERSISSYFRSRAGTATLSLRKSRSRLIMPRYTRRWCRTTMTLR